MVLFHVIATTDALDLVNRHAERFRLCPANSSLPAWLKTGSEAVPEARSVP
jgi:hypothetical protein